MTPGTILAVRDSIRDVLNFSFVTPSGKMKSSLKKFLIIPSIFFFLDFSQLIIYYTINLSFLKFSGRLNVIKSDAFFQKKFLGFSRRLLLKHRKMNGTVK